MNSKLFARVGAGAFVAIAITMAVLELREEHGAPQAEIITVSDESHDGAKATLAYCSELGLEAASVDICTEAWAAERRRFLGQAERAAAADDAVPNASAVEPEPITTPDRAPNMTEAN
jgi:conjugative transfer region protein TrbK